MKNRIRHLTCAAILSALAIMGVALDARADDATPEKPSWHCLPANTVVALRLPEPAAFVQTMRQRTRLGQLIFAEPRTEELTGMIQDVMGDEWERMLEVLGRHELEPADLPRLFAGDTGAALTLELRDEREPIAVMLAWAEPGTDLAQRVMSAADKAAADALEEGAVLQRHDIELSGHEVMHLSLPVEGMDRDLSWEMPDDWMELSPEEQAAHWEQRRRDREEAETIVLDRTHLLLTRVGGRLLLAATFPQSRTTVRDMDEAERARIDWDQFTGLDEATGVFTRFLARHAGEDGPFVNEMRRTPGLLAALPAGVPLGEFYASPPTVLRLLEDAADRGVADAEDLLKIVELLRELGLDGLGPMAFRASLDENVLRFDGFLAMPAPRTGVLELFDQPALPAAPADWVNAEPTSYNHLSLDLAELYRMVRQRVIAAVGEDARASYEWAEQVVEMQIQSTITELLASFGHKHMFLTFETRIVEFERPDYSQFDPETGETPTETVRQPQQRMAFVWELQDAGVWDRLFHVISMWAGMAGDALESVEEQGFTGWRIEEGGMEGGLFHDGNHLVMTVGEEVAESVLTMLRNPPADDAGLRRGALHADADRVLAPQAGLYYSISDYNRALIEMRRTIAETLDDEADAGLDGFGVLADPRAFIRDLLPSEAELDGAAGVNVAQGYVNDEGFVMQSALELPPAAAE